MKPFPSFFLSLKNSKSKKNKNLTGCQCAQWCMHAQGARVPCACSSPSVDVQCLPVGWLISVRAFCACANLECPFFELCVLVLSLFCSERCLAWTGCLEPDPWLSDGCCGLAARSPAAGTSHQVASLPPPPFFKTKQTRN